MMVLSNNYLEAAKPKITSLTTLSNSRETEVPAIDSREVLVAVLAFLNSSSILETPHRVYTLETQSDLNRTTGKHSSRSR